MFGLLTSTLTQFKRESETDRAATAAQRRAQVEARLASKLKDSEKAVERTEKRRALFWEARWIAEEIAQGDAQRKTIRGMKRRMASFLFTPTPAGRGGESRRERQRGDEGKLEDGIPMNLAPARGRREEESFALYFLPGKTLPEQEDKLNEQEDAVDERIDRWDDEWEEKRKALMDRLEKVKERIRSL